MSTRGFRFNRTAIASAVVALLSCQAHADQVRPDGQSAATESTVQRVVIQARGRSETEQSVPVSVKAFSSKALEDANVKGIGDFVALTPNVSIVQSESAGSSFMTVRGLTQVRNSEAPIAMVIDGVALFNSKQFTQDLFDIQAVEVLRGPQGALYGRNASGGAMVVTTKQPTNVFKAFVQPSIASGNEKAVQGAISGPLVENKLLFRVAGSFKDRDGVLENTYLHDKVDFLKDSSVRGLLKWMASNDLTVELRTNYVHTNGGAVNFQYQPVLFDRANPCFADPVNPFGGPAPDPNRVARTFCANNRGQNVRDLSEVTVKFDYTLPFAALTGVFSHNRVKEYIAGDQFPYTASRNLFGSLDSTQTQFNDVTGDSAELRLTSPTSQSARWMAGVYYLKTKRFVSTATGTDNGTGATRLERDPKFTDPSNPTTSWIADDNHNRAWAVFGNVDYDLSKQTELSVAMRYDSDRRKQQVDPRQTSSTPVGCTVSAPERCEKNASYSAMQPKVSLRYKFDDQSLAYVSAGRGFRSGQFNQSGVANAAAKAGITGVSDQVDREITDSYEVGYKTTFLNGKVQMNAALFDSTVKNSPYFVFIGSIGAQVLVPIDKARLQGGELEATSNIAPGLDVYAGVGVTKSTIKEYAINPALVGNRAPYVPQLSWNTGIQQRTPISHGLKLVMRADVISKGKQYWDPENSAPRDTVTLVNLRAGIEDSKGKWSLMASVNNAFDHAYNAEFVNGGFAQPALPRAYRLDLRYNF
jgi:iron complex outermembrane recepter protein